MFIGFRPCHRRVKWRRKRLPEKTTGILVCTLLSILIIGLLFLCPQWLLVLMVVVLSVITCLLLKN